MKRMILLDEDEYKSLIERSEPQNIIGTGLVPKEDPPISQREICSFLNITEPTLIRWRKRGKIPFIKIGSRVLYQKSVVIDALAINKGGKS